MVNKNYYAWFQKLVTLLIQVFFYVASILTVYVFVSVFSGIVKYVLFVVLLLIYFGVIYFFKDKIKLCIDKVIDRCKKLDEKKMLLIIVITMIIFKIITSLFFYFDATIATDTQIYNDIADTIIETGNLKSDAISHLFGIAIHFVLFKLIGMPLHVGTFIAILVGTVINFLSFKDIVGKDKAFICVMTYILMPSTSFFCYCLTHEIFVYLYFSIFVYLLNRLLRSEKDYILAIPLVLDIFLLCLVNPAGMISYIIIILLIVLSKIDIRKKIIVGLVLLLSVGLSNFKDSVLETDTYRTSINTYSILIHGSNPNTLGEMDEGYPLRQMRQFIIENNMGVEQKDFLLAARTILLRQYTYLLTHPVTLFKMILHKAYILWSGDHYALEMAHSFNGINTIMYYVLLVINTLIYLFVLTVGWVYRETKDDPIEVVNYKLVILGVIALTLITSLLNKYDIYITLYIYFIAIYSMCQSSE